MSFYSLTLLYWSLIISDEPVANMKEITIGWFIQSAMLLITSLPTLTLIYWSSIIVDDPTVNVILSNRRYFLKSTTLNMK